MPMFLILFFWFKGATIPTENPIYPPHHKHPPHIMGTR
jgi:hypothetical protein